MTLTIKIYKNCTILGHKRGGGGLYQISQARVDILL